MQHVRDLTDPEHPYTLEQLKVVNEEAITVRDEEGIVRWASEIALTQLHEESSRRGVPPLDPPY